MIAKLSFILLSFLTNIYTYTKHAHKVRSYNLDDIAPFKRARPQNAPGNLYVDESCIDCDVCRWMCPSVFARKGIKSIVQNQPTNEDQKLLAYSAMVACPVGSIRMRVPDPLAKIVATEIFPAEIDPVRIPGIFHLGYHASQSFGATPYLVKRPDGKGNIMVDSPRYSSKLAAAIELEGGVRYMILTHKDDIADHAKWKERFPGMERIMHRADVSAAIDTCEIKLSGGGVWEPDTDFKIVHTPGHTGGSLTIIVDTLGGESVAFTGDHLAYSQSKGALTGFKQYNHGNIEVQESSMRRLAQDDISFTWILPAHGRMARFETREACVNSLLAAAVAFALEDESYGSLSVGYY